MSAGKTVQTVLAGALILFLLVFAGVKTRGLVFGTTINIDSPRNGSTVTNSFITIRGEAPDSALLTINGAKVLTDAKGSFEHPILLGLGYNVIEVLSLDRFNRAHSQTLELVYRPSDKATSTVAFNN